MAEDILQPPSLDARTAETLSNILLRSVQQEYPNHPAHILYGPEDVANPKALHPVFYGCFDWHSAVHSHWSLVRLYNLGLLPEPDAALTVLNRHLSEENLAVELAYLKDPRRSGFERTYGWVWLLTLAAELRSSSGSDWRALANNLGPLEEFLAVRLEAFLTRLSHANRTGLHNNTAFTLGLAWDYAVRAGLCSLEITVRQNAERLFLNDREVQIADEPGPTDFLSPALIEADFMTRILGKNFPAWFDSFLPGFEGSALNPVEVTDRSDLGLIHLDGLNLSRAWCLSRIAEALPRGGGRIETLQAAAKRHANASLPFIASGHYGGEHWLPTFAVFLLT